MRNALYTLVAAAAVLVAAPTVSEAQAGARARRCAEFTACDRAEDRRDRREDRRDRREDVRDVRHDGGRRDRIEDRRDRREDVRDRAEDRRERRRERRAIRG